MDHAGNMENMFFNYTRQRFRHPLSTTRSSINVVRFVLYCGCKGPSLKTASQKALTRQQTKTGRDFPSITHTVEYTTLI